MYGTQTHEYTCSDKHGFENDVKMYGTQTHPWNKRPFTVFENDVKMYGTQTEIQYDILKFCLRMM